MVLERSPVLSRERASALGWGLFEAGYRPLLGRLALQHALAEYAHDFEADPFRRLFAAAGALDSFLPTPDILPPGRREPFLHVAAVPILDALLSVSWNDASLPDDERPKLGTAILDGCWSLIGDASVRDALGPNVARLLLSRAVRARQDPDADDVSEGDPEAERWLATALSERLSDDDRATVARAVEDTAIDFYRGLRDQPPDEDDGPQSAEDALVDERMVRRLAARTGWRRLAPLIQTPLLNDLAPIVRRVLALLAGNPEAGFIWRTYSGPFDGTVRVDEDDIERAAINAVRAAAAGQAGLASPVYLSRVHGTWARTVPDEDREQTPSLPETHSVDVDVSDLALVLRNDPDLQPVLVGRLARSLDHADPPLRTRLLDLHDSLLSPDDETRALAVERLADAAVGSVLLDLERDPAHAVQRLRSRTLDGLESWLYAPLSDSPHDRADVVSYVDYRAPLDSLQAVQLLSLDGSQSDAHFFPNTDDLLNGVEEGTHPDLDTVCTAITDAAETHRSSFSSVNAFLMVLHLAARRPEGIVEAPVQRPTEWRTRGAMPLAEWVRHFVASVLGAEGDGLPLRDPTLAHGHSRVLRLALYACSGTPAMEALFERADGDADRVAGEWATSVLVAADRLGPYLADRYPDPAVAVDELDRACERLGFVLDEPGYTGDWFNPLAIGPGLVDYEPWLMLHALDRTWDALAEPGAQPLWWSPETARALEAIADAPHNHEAALSAGIPRNGLGVTLDQPPSVIARHLLGRAETAGTV